MKKEKQTQDLFGGLYDVELEGQVLGALILDPETLEKTQERLGKLGSKAFFSAEARLIYEVALKLKEEGKPVNPLTIKRAIKKQAKGKEIPLPTLDKLVDNAVSAGGAVLDHYLGELKTLAVKREYRRLTYKFDQALGDGKDPEKAKQVLVDGLAKLKTTEKRKGLTLLKSLATPVKESVSPVGGGLLVPGRYTIIAATDGEGKTTFMLQFALCAASGITFLGSFPIKRPVKVLYFCGENSRGDINDKTQKQIPELEKLVKGGDASKYLENLIIASPLEIDFLLDKKEDRASLVWWLKTYKPDIVIFDPLNDFVSTEKSLSDDVIARQTSKALDSIARDFNCFPILVTHFKKQEKDEPQSIFEKIHGSKYWTNPAAAQVCMDRAQKQQYETAKRLHFKLKTVTEAPKLLVNRDRDSLWYSEISKDELSKAKLLPKHLVAFVIEKCDGQAVPSILNDTAAEGLNCSQTQIKELTKLALEQGLMEKRRGILIPLIVKRRGEGK